MSKLVIFSGAGISADSGVSTFRDHDGLWENHSVDVVANLTTWKANFSLVHRFYNQRRMQLAEVEPNSAHKMVADWQRRYNTVNITQNVDDLFERAGCEDVIHVHGKLTEMQCTACGHVWQIGYNEWDDEHRCASGKCQSRKGVKPHVVFFNENAPLYRDMYKAFVGLGPSDMLVVIGTSGQVVDIGTMANHAREAGCFTVLNNLAPDDEFIPDRQFDVAIHGRASETIEALDELVRERLDT